jgi:hypothetical protein
LRFRSFQEFLGALAGVGHAIVQHQVREIAEAQQLRFRPAQFQNAAQQRAIVMLALGWRGRISVVHLAADAASSRYVITGV